MSEHKYIWLQPECCADPDEGRHWCKDPDPVDCDEGKPWTKYILAAEHEALRAELAALTSEYEAYKAVATMGESERNAKLLSDLSRLTLERDRLREAVEWQPITETTLPERHQPVALLDINRFQNCHFELNIQDVGYLEGEAPMFYWAIRGERAQEIHAFTHWKYLGAPPTQPQPGGGDE